MKKAPHLFSAATAILLVSACSQGDDGVNQAANEQSASDMNSMMNDPNNPFAEAEMQMNERMMAAVGTDVGDNWAKKMIEHHQGAIDMSEIVLQQDPPADVAQMARETIEKQRKDIEDIRKLLKEGSPDQRSAELYRPAMMEMHQKMQAATGATAAESYMRKMREHHLGAVAMSDVALQNGVSGALREQVQKTRDENGKDAKMVEAMLRGESMQHAMEQSGAKSAAEARAEAAPAEKAAAPPKAIPRAAPKAAPKEQPKAADPQTPASGSTCAPEHRAAGHC